jgi:hypothetical protein
MKPCIERAQQSVVVDARQRRRGEGTLFANKLQRNRQRHVGSGFNTSPMQAVARLLYECNYIRHTKQLTVYAVQLLHSLAASVQEYRVILPSPHFKQVSRKSTVDITGYNLIGQGNFHSFCANNATVGVKATILTA